jgi:flagellar protein FlbD
MIELTKLNYEKYYMNCDLIEIIEQIPDTLITMTTGKKYYALETPQEIISKIMEYKKSVVESCSLNKKHKPRPQREEKEE